ncbi:MAG: hypothetical protein U9Q22_03855 [Candidatus Altiarchaeota archaeon]|nr:hypothetical protein [Candidatus Altiarchaeota archaeon]
MKSIYLTVFKTITDVFTSSTLPIPAFSADKATWKDNPTVTGFIDRYHG